MDEKSISRRQLLHTAATIGAAGAFVPGAPEAAPRMGRTPPMTPDEMAAIDEAMRKKGKYNEPQATYTVALPRYDLNVTIHGDKIPTPFGFSGWVSIKKTTGGKSCVLMSDTVLLQEEVNGLVASAQANGLEVSAMHNHFFYDEPRIIFMHIHGMGSAAELSARFAAAVKSTKLFPPNQGPPGPPPAETEKAVLDFPALVLALDEIVKYKGVVNGPTYKYTIGRSDLRVIMMGAEMTAAIGLNSWAAFAGDRENAHIAGDIAMVEPEVNRVIAALVKNKLEVVALHSHMLGEQPRIIFLHYYGRGATTSLARGFRAALDELGK